MYECMNVCNVCMYVCMYVCMTIRTICLLKIHVCVRVFFVECMNMNTFVCMYVAFFVECNCVCVCARAILSKKPASFKYTCMHVCVYTCTYILHTRVTYIHAN